MSEALRIAVATISDTRSRANDSSGDYLCSALEQSGHSVAERSIIHDDVYQIRALLSQWIARADVNAIITSGGTGFSGRDSTPQAVRCLFDSTIEGFGEIFRYFSVLEIGSSSVQSRALAGIANKTGIFCLPGSPAACRTGWENILKEQFDSTHRPCNFAHLFLHGRHPG